jgi:Zn-dependent protease/CBS domain-containing protein
VVAKRNGLRIRQITLFLFGGVSEIEEEPQNPGLELRMAAAGPLTSVVLAGACWLLWMGSVLTGASPLVQAPLQYTALVNGIVAAFNLIPAFPMDGGRVLRSLLWMRSGNLLNSTKAASATGKAFAYLMVFAGVLLIFSVDLVTGFWLIIIGWFISSGAQSALSQTIIQEDLKGKKASEVMTRNVHSVPPEMSLEELSQEFFHLKHNGFPVLSGDELRGCVTTEDLRKTGKDSWQSASVREVMTPREKLVTLGEDEAATRAIRLMNEKRIGRVFVVQGDGRLAGVITRSDVLRSVHVQEAALGFGGSSRPSSRVTITAELGMNFVLDQPVEAGLVWKAELAGDGIQLVSAEAVATPQGDVRRFVFHADKIGEHVVRLAEIPLEKAPPSKEVRPVRTVSYLVSVYKPRPPDHSLSGGGIGG